MKQEIHQLLRTAPAALVLALAGASLHAQQPDVKAAPPEAAQSAEHEARQSHQSHQDHQPRHPTPAPEARPQEVPPGGVDAALPPVTATTERQAVDPSARPAPAPVAHQSSDQNVPPATARKQAAEIAQGDPARWYREDVTAAERLRTVRKEIAAGLQEAQGNCRRMATAERAACLKEARAIYAKEMAGARARVMAEGQR